jgi:hypothetical protein
MTTLPPTTERSHDSPRQEHDQRATGVRTASVCQCAPATTSASARPHRPTGATHQRLERSRLRGCSFGPNSTTPVRARAPASPESAGAPRLLVVVRSSTEPATGPWLCSSLRSGSRPSGSGRAEDCALATIRCFAVERDVVEVRAAASALRPFGRTRTWRGRRDRLSRVAGLMSPRMGMTILVRKQVVRRTVNQHSRLHRCVRARAHARPGT